MTILKISRKSDSFLYRQATHNRKTSWLVMLTRAIAMWDTVYLLAHWWDPVARVETGLGSHMSAKSDDDQGKFKGNPLINAQRI